MKTCEKIQDKIAGKYDTTTELGQKIAFNACQEYANKKRNRSIEYNFFREKPWAQVLPSDLFLAEVMWRSLEGQKAGPDPTRIPHRLSRPSVDMDGKRRRVLSRGLRGRSKAADQQTG